MNASVAGGPRAMAIAQEIEQKERVVAHLGDALASTAAVLLPAVDLAAGAGRGAAEAAEEASEAEVEAGAAAPVPGFFNTPVTNDGLYYTGHALDQMQSRGIVPSVVQDAIQYGVRSVGKEPDTLQFDSVNVRVITSSDLQRVITVWKVR